MSYSSTLPRSVFSDIASSVVEGGVKAATTGGGFSGFVSGSLESFSNRGGFTNLANVAFGAFSGGGGGAGAGDAIGAVAASNVSTDVSSLFSGSSPSLNSAAESLAGKIDGSEAGAAVFGSGGEELGKKLTDAFIQAATDPTWTFICTPDEISWNTSNAVNRVEMFGTNNPPAISGTKGMRELSLNNSLVEGFSRNKKVEAKVAALEALLKYKPSLEGGYVNVPVYQIWANQKGYGEQAYFLIKSVQVKETMRDLAGDTTRALVDVSFIEVPAFQVDSGIDQAPFSQQGANSSLVKTGLTSSQAALEQAKQTKPTSGASAPPPVPPTRR